MLLNEKDCPKRNCTLSLRKALGKVNDRDYILFRQSLYYWVITFELSGSFHQYGLEAPKLDAQSPNLGYASKMLVVSTGTRKLGTSFDSYTDTANL